MLVFENKEEIDIRGITTFGTSSKNNAAQAIGFFGTGLKYAIAVLLRNNCAIKIYSGQTQYEFEKQQVKIRNDEFEVVKMIWRENGELYQSQELAFTTQLGKTWELWQAYRELYCNAIDEDGTVEFVTKAPRAKKGTTRIVVEGLDDIHSGRGDFILESEPLFKLSQIEIHPLREGKGAIFYKGVRVYQPKDTMLYSYNLLHRQELTEDRTLKYIHLANHAVMYSIINCQVMQPVVDIVTAPEATYEGQLNFQYMDGNTPGEVFLAAMNVQRKADVNKSSYGYYSGYAVANLDNLPRKSLSVGQATILSEAKSLLLPLGFEELYSIVVTEMLSEKEICKASNNTIYLSPNVFALQQLEIAALIFDAYSELKFKEDKNFTIIKDFIKYANPEYFSDEAQEEAERKEFARQVMEGKQEELFEPSLAEQIRVKADAAVLEANRLNKQLADFDPF